MHRYFKIAMKVAMRPKVLIEKLGRRMLRLSWNYPISPMDESTLNSFVEVCRDQARREAVKVAQELGVQPPVSNEPYMARVDNNNHKVIVDVNFSILPGQEQTWLDVVELLKEGGWL